MVWELLGAAAELDAVPILICRRYPETLPPFISLTGGFVYRTVKTIYPPEVEGELHSPGDPSFMESFEALGSHTDALVIPEGEVRAADVRFWQDTLPARVEDMHDRFTFLADEIKELAFGDGLRTERSRGRLSERFR